MKIERIKSIIRAPWRRGFLLILFAIAGLALLPQARAVCQEGCDLNNGNTFLGDDALLSNIGDNNTANGSYAFFWNTTGNNNTATGDGALVQNTTASDNTATGVQALGRNTTGFRNTANGFLALINNVTGANNTAEGYQALRIT